MTQVTKAWGNRLSPKLEKKKVKSKVALMKVRTNFDLEYHLIFLYCQVQKYFKLSAASLYSLCLL